jgi:hypothetical protein
MSALVIAVIAVGSLVETQNRFRGSAKMLMIKHCIYCPYLRQWYYTLRLYNIMEECLSWGYIGHFRGCGFGVNDS